jgi:hypothetical protein
MSIVLVKEVMMRNQLPREEILINFLKARVMILSLKVQIRVMMTISRPRCQRNNVRTIKSRRARIASCSKNPNKISKVLCVI